MNVVVILVIACAVISLLASILVVSACILSARISHASQQKDYPTESRNTSSRDIPQISS